MKTIYKLICAICVVCGFTACQDRDLPGSGEMQLSSPEASQITGTPSGENDYDYTLTWPQSAQGATMQVAVYKNGTQMQGLTPCPSGSFTLKNLETNQLYEFLFKYADNDALSNGVMTSYTRPGASAPSDLKFEQIDISDDQRDMQLTWTASSDATSYILQLVNGDGSRVIEETVNGTSYLLKDVAMKERWEATLIAQNAEGKASMVPARLVARFLLSCQNMPHQRSLLPTAMTMRPQPGCGSRRTTRRANTFTSAISTPSTTSLTIACSSGCATSRPAMPTTSGTSPKSP